jgi:uncharacterized protein YehS (DUF1456 family)
MALHTLWRAIARFGYKESKERFVLTAESMKIPIVETSPVIRAESFRLFMTCLDVELRYYLIK